MAGSIIIIGAGPGGACLAYLMAQAGVTVTLLERHSDFAREFRGERIMDAGVAALQTMGLWEKLEGVPKLRLQRSQTYIDRVLAVRTEVPDNGPMVLFLPQPPFLEAVVEAASAFPGFTFLRRVTANHLIEEQGRVVGITAKVAGEDRELRADLVVCADGRYSKMRSLAGLADQIPGDAESYDVVWLSLPAPEDMRRTSTSRSFIGKGTLAWAFIAPSGNISMGWVIPKGSFAEMNRGGEKAWFDKLLELLPEDMQAHMRAHQETMSHSMLSVVCYSVQKWWKPGLLMIGDASHPMSPSGGQGITSAFRDAIAATNLLAPVLRGLSAPKALDDACAMLQAVRQAEILPIQKKQRRMSRVMLQEALVGKLLMRHLLPFLARVVPGLMARVAAGPKNMREGNPLFLDPSLRGAATVREAA